MSGYRWFVAFRMPVLNDLQKVAAEWQIQSEEDKKLWKCFGYAPYVKSVWSKLTDPDLKQVASSWRQLAECGQVPTPLTTMASMTSRASRPSKKALSGYNLFFQEKTKTAEWKEMYPTHLARLQAIGAAWRSLEKKDKERYTTCAVAQNALEGRRPVKPWTIDQPVL